MSWFVPRVLSVALSDVILLVWFKIASSSGTGLHLLPGARAEDFRRDLLIFRRTKWGSVVTENSKGGIAENFGRIQRGDHSNFLGK